MPGFDNERWAESRWICSIYLAMRLKASRFSWHATLLWQYDFIWVVLPSTKARWIREVADQQITGQAMGSRPFLAIPNVDGLEGNSINQDIISQRKHIDNILLIRRTKQAADAVPTKYRAQDGVRVIEW